MASPATGPKPAIKDNITVPQPLDTPNVPSLYLTGKGVQIYDCKPVAAEPGKLEWVFRAPEADLYDSSGRKFGTHFAGPTWQAEDGSKVTGEVAGKMNAPDPNSIPHLLLAVKSISAGTQPGTGHSFHGLYTFIQRTETNGGKPPATTGDAKAGDLARVPYEALYTFWELSNLGA